MTNQDESGKNLSSFAGPKNEMEANLREPIHLGNDYFIEDNRSIFLVGTNYMPSKAFRRFWHDWDPNQIEQDFARMKELRVRAVRVPLFWESVEPEEGIISNSFLERFDEFLEIAKKYDVHVMPFLFAGACAEYGDPPWRKARDAHKNPQILELERKHAETLASRYADNPVIIAWDISDEPYYLAGNTDAETATNWVSMICEALKSLDNTHPVTLGFRNNHMTEDTGFQVERLTPFLDFFSLCAYPVHSLKTPEAHTSTRSTYFTSFLIKFSDVGKPVLLSEGPSTTTILTSPERAADYHRVVMYSSFVNRAIGVMPWTLLDCDVQHHGQIPLDDNPYETSFGILNSNGEMKPPAEELSRFAQTIKNIDLEDFHFRRPEAALLIPKDYYKHVRTVWPRLFEAFILAKEAHIELDFLREGADLTGHKLIIVPSVLSMRTSSWHAFRSYIEHGGHLYFSYGGSWTGSLSPLGPFFNEIFNVSLQDRIAPMPLEQVRLTRDWMGLLGLTLAYPRTEGASCIELEPDSGFAVGKDARGNTALVVNRGLGKGTAILVTHPLEYYLSLVPDAYQKDETFRIYDTLRKEAGLSEPFTCDSPHLEAGWMESKSRNEAILILINHERVTINSAISLSLVWEVRGLPGGEEIIPHIAADRTWMRPRFSPSEVKIFHLKR